MTLLDRIRARLDEDPEELEAQANRDWCCDLPGVTRASDVESRSRAKVGGVVQSIRIVPSEHTTTLAIRISDGTGEVTGRWPGRRQIKGIRLGSRLVLEGTFVDSPEPSVTRLLEVLNPGYDLIPSE